MKAVVLACLLMMMCTAGISHAQMSEDTNSNTINRAKINHDYDWQAFPADGEYQWREYESSRLVRNQGAVLEASATILALTIFSAVLGVRINERWEIAKKQGIMILVILIGAGLIAGAQLFMMFYACCTNLTVFTYWVYLLVSGGSFLGVIAGFGITIWIHIRDVHRGTFTSNFDKTNPNQDS